MLDLTCATLIHASLNLYRLDTARQYMLPQLFNTSSPADQHVRSLPWMLSAVGLDRIGNRFGNCSNGQEAEFDCRHCRVTPLMRVATMCSVGYRLAFANSLHGESAKGDPVLVTSWSFGSDGGPAKGGERK